MTTQVIVITGGSRGIGKSTALLAARRGYKVCICYENKVSLAENLVEEIKSQGGEALSVQADVSVPEEVKRLFDIAGEKLGPLTALVNNAGISGDREKLVNLDISSIKRVLDVNLLGTILCTQEAVKRMALSEGGKGGGIINISSQVAFFGGQQLIPYAASKAAINNFTLALSKEVADEEIRVNAISPGIIDTDQHDFSASQPGGEVSDQIPLKRLGAPEEVAEAILWLLSKNSSYITGVVLPVAGGR